MIAPGFRTEADVLRYTIAVTRRYVYDIDDALDCAGAAMVDILARAVPSVRAVRSEKQKAYFTSSVFHAVMGALKRYRNQQRRSHLRINDVLVNSLDHGVDAVGMWSDKGNSADAIVERVSLNQVWERMDSDERTIIYLMSNGMVSKDIAEATGIPTKVIEYRLRRIRRKTLFQWGLKEVSL